MTKTFRFDSDMKGAKAATACASVQKGATAGLGDGRGAAVAGVAAQARPMALGTLAVAALAVAGMVSPASAMAQGTAQAAPADAAQVIVGSDAAAETAAHGQVKLAQVQGAFAFTQGEVTPTDQIARALGGADKVLCGAAREAIPSVQEVVPDAASWQIAIDGDGVQAPAAVTLGELAQTGSQSAVMGCSCLGNPADGRASVNAAVTGVPVLELLEAAGGVSEDANAITFVSSDGYEVTLPLFYVLQRSSMIVYQANGEPLSASMGGTNQLWLGSTSARYFASDVTEVRVTCEDEVPAIPGSPASDDHAANLPNASVTAGGTAA